MVFAGPATDKILEVQIVRFVVFAGPATDNILEVRIVKFVVFWESRLLSSSMLHEPVVTATLC